MGRLTNHTVRAGVSAVGVAAVLMALASTTQTPNGFIQASFGGPLDIFSGPSTQSDVFTMGDDTADTSDLAAILNGPVAQTSPASPYRDAYEAGAGPLAVGAVPAPDPAAGVPTVKQSLGLPRKPVVDAMGRVDCTGAVSCKTDPNTNVTTVTYPDGAVALIQQVNDMTVVAYKFPAPAPNAAPLPASAPPVVEAAAPQNVAPTADPATATDISASTIRPRVGGTRVPQNPAPGHSGTSSVPGGITLPAIKPTGPIDVVKDVIGSVVNAVTGHHASQTKKPVDAPAPSAPAPAPANTPGTSADNGQNSGTDSGQ
jgi:hypothetical protein